MKIIDHDSFLTESQKYQLKTEGYCIMVPITDNDKTINLCFGYIRINESKHQLIFIPGIILKILKYCQGRYDPKYYVELQSGGDEEKGDEIKCYLLPKNNIKLSGLLSNMVDDTTNSTIILNQVPSSTLHAICEYLGHHKNIKPDPIPRPLPSIYLSDCVSDIWDSVWMDKKCKKEIFEIILAANYMDIDCLLHLGCAKIATLIKQLDQREIDRILHPGHAINTNNTTHNGANTSTNNNIFSAFNWFGRNNRNDSNNNGNNGWSFNWFNRNKNDDKNNNKRFSFFNRKNKR